MFKGLVLNKLLKLFKFLLGVCFDCFTTIIGIGFFASIIRPPVASKNNNVLSFIYFSYNLKISFLFLNFTLFVIIESWYSLIPIVCAVFVNLHSKTFVGGEFKPPESYIAPKENISSALLFIVYFCLPILLLL